MGRHHGPASKALLPVLSSMAAARLGRSRPPPPGKSQEITPDRGDLCLVIQIADLRIGEIFTFWVRKTNSSAKGLCPAHLPGVFALGPKPRPPTFRPTLVDFTRSGVNLSGDLPPCFPWLRLVYSHRPGDASLPRDSTECHGLYILPKGRVSCSIVLKECFPKCLTYYCEIALNFGGGPNRLSGMLASHPLTGWYND